MQPTRTVLVVDDEDPIRRMVEVYLRMAGYAVISTGEGEKAVDLAQTHDPDVVITDLGLPGMSGQQFCEEVELLQRCKPFLTIVITGNDDASETDWTSHRPATVVVFKPFAPSTLLDEINRFFAQFGTSDS